jgi:hypothetical protein
MRSKLSTIIVLAILLSSFYYTGCKKDTETIDGLPISMTAKLNGNDWSTSQVSANYNSGIISIFGYNPLKGTIVISINEFDEGTYEFGSDINKFATYANKDQIIYYTNPYGSGEISISSIDTDKKYLTGTFNFIAKDVSGNTITATEGAFTTRYN